MRKKIATLEVYLDDSITSSACGAQWSGLLSDPKNAKARNDNWRILLNPNGDGTIEKGANLLTTFAHELGHFAAQVLRTPAALEDIHNMAKSEALVSQISTEFHDKTGLDPEKLGIVPPEGDAWHLFAPAIRGKYKAESEAWDIARMIHPSLNEGEAEAALDTYREGIRRIASGDIKDFKSNEEEAAEAASALKEAA